MNNCEDIKTLIDDYLAGEITLRNLNRLQQHVENCEYCLALMEIHCEVTDEDESMPMASDSQLAQMRARVIQQVEKDNRQNLAQESNIREVVITQPTNVHSLEEKPAARQQRKNWHYGFAAAAMLMVAIMVGRWSTNLDGTSTSLQYAEQPVMQGKGLEDDSALINQLTRYASMKPASQDLTQQYWDAPVSYANVSFGQVRGNSMELGFDVCRRVDMMTSRDSAIAKEVMLHAILNPTSLGGKFRAMQVAATTMDNRLVEALILTLHNDEALAVRIEAFSILSGLPQNETIERAFLMTLQKDSAVKMRLMALKQLSLSESLGADILLETIRGGSEESSAALIHALQQKSVRPKAKPNDV